MEKKKNTVKILGIILILCIIIVGVYLALLGSNGGGSGDFSNPKNTIETYYQAFNNQNAEKVHESFSSNMKTVWTKTRVENWLSGRAEHNFQYTILEYTKVSKGEKSATVKLKLIENHEGLENGIILGKEFNLINEDGEWKIKNMGDIN